MPVKGSSIQRNDVAARLRQQGHRLTPQRLTVLDIVAHSGKHLTADEIFVAVQAQHPFTNIATVYRTLQWLQQAGFVAPLLLNGEPVRYEFISGESHHHLICRNCSAEQEIGDDVLDTLKADLLARYGFAAQLQHLALTGLCESCRAAAEAAEQE